MKHNYPKNVYELKETLFEKLEGFSLPVSENNKPFNNLADMILSRFVFL